MVGAIWLGIFLGFVPEIMQHVAAHKPAYPAIIHIHALIFGGWLVLLSVQSLLVGRGRFQAHRRLGLLGAGLAAAMIIVGPLTAYTMDRLEYGTPDDNTPFLFVQMTDIFAFAVLAGAGLLLRHDRSAHKRLILLATLYISDAGFSRWLGPVINPASSHAFVPYFMGLYLGNDLLMLVMGAYDLMTRRRLHLAYGVAMVFIIGVQLVSATVRLTPGWQPIAAHLLGH
jgi:hypothetical protein